MIAGGTSHALKDLDGVARDAAAYAVVQRASESRLATTVSVEVNVELVLQAALVIEL